MSANFLSLDWRQAPSATDVIERLHRLFTEVDDRGSASLRLSQSSAKTAFAMVARNGHQTVMRRDNPSRRNFSGQAKYWSQAYAVASSLVEMQADERMLKIRFIEYKDVFPNTAMTLDQVKRILYDLALTIKVHPLALGVLTEDSGQFYLSDGVEIKAVMIDNIITYHKTTESDEYRGKVVKKEKFKHADNYMHIPQLVESLKVIVLSKRSVRAVVVTEHANISNLLSDDRFGIQNNIIVTTSGYPGHSTMEFLHMLSEDVVMKEVPFLYIADHDFHGFHIFSVLKYGCRASAWASEIQTCPRLQWIGPSREDLVKSPAAYRPLWEAQFKVDNPRSPDNEVKKASASWQTKLEQRINQKFVTTYKKDRELYRGFQRTGWLRHESNVSWELDLMLRQDCKFRVADMAQVSTRYLQIIMETKIEELCPSQVEMSKGVVIRRPVYRSLVGERFKNIESQALVSNQSASATATPAVATREPSAEEFRIKLASAIAEMK